MTDTSTGVEAPKKTKKSQRLTNSSASRLQGFKIDGMKARRLLRASRHQTQTRHELGMVAWFRRVEGGTRRPHKEIPPVALRRQKPRGPFF